jgi:ABC-type dipeptide/oligopeptide/nickel transport system permease component
MSTGLYVLRRLVILLPQLLLISVATFVLIRLLPGDPARLELGPLAPDEGVAALREQLKLDEPLPAQYIAYLDRLFHGDLGRSWVNSSEVTADLGERIPATLELLVLGLALVLIVMVPIGAITSARGGGLATRGLRKLTFGYGLMAGALPDFWLGLLLIFVFSSQLGLTPGPEGRLGIGELPPAEVTGMYSFDALIAGDLALFASAVSHLILPVITLAFVYGAPILKMTNATMSAALRADYTTYAEGFGLPRRTILWYALRNAAPPIIVITGVISGYLLGGAVLIETVFNLNGVGQYAVQAITTADYAPIQAFVLIAAVFTMLVYLVVDLVYFATDPRVRAGRKAG